MKKKVLAAAAALAMTVLVSQIAFADDGYVYDSSTLTYTVTSSEGLAAAAEQINAAESGSYTISLGADVDTNGVYFTKNSTTIIGNGHTIYVRNNTINVNGGILNLGNTENAAKLTVSGEKKTSEGTTVLQINGDGIANMYGNTYVGYCAAGNQVPAIAVNQGVFNMYGGEVTDVKCAGYGAVTLTNYSMLSPATDHAEFNMYGGKITENETGYYGAVFALGSGCVFNMYGGEISGNEAMLGGGVSLWGATFNMKGGKISGNTAGYYGGGVFIFGYSADSAFNMEGGEISGNTAGFYGGGVAVYAEDDVNDDDDNYDSVFNLSGGTISGNTAGYCGGGVCVFGENYTSDLVFNMSGGTISGNTASGAPGAGVYYDDSSTVTLSGAVNITGNTYNGAASNLYVNSTENPIYIKGSLEGSEIGVSDPVLWDDELSDDDAAAVSAVRLTSGYDTYNSGVAPSAYFTSDHATWYAGYSEDSTELRLVRTDVNVTDVNVIVLPVAESESKQGAYSDAGYYGVDKDDTQNEAARGVIRFASYVENGSGFAVTEIGTKLTLGSNTVTKSKTVPSISGSFTFSIDVTDIPASYWDTAITAASYAGSDGSVFDSINSQSIKVNDNLKWLGAATGYGSRTYTDTNADSDVIAAIKAEKEGN